jgi:hypothetical protein
MSLHDGTFALSRYRLDQDPPPELWPRVKDLVGRFALTDLEETGAEQGLGWVDAADPFGPDGSGTSLGPFVVLGLRHDTRVVPPAVLRRYLELARRAGPSGGSAAPGAVKDLKDRVGAELRRRMPVTTRVVQVVWDTDTGVIWLGAATTKWRQMFEDLFVKTFDLIPILQAPPILAGRLRPDWTEDDLLRLTPANLAQIVGSR